MKKVNIGNVPKMLVPLFESGTIVFCRDFTEWQRLHQKLGVDVHDSDANGASHTMSSENGVLHVIGVFNGKLSTIAHECAHMAFDICSRVGVDVEPGRARVKGDAGRYHILGVLWHERALILSRPHGYIEKVSIDRVEILPLTPEEEETYGLFDN